MTEYFSDRQGYRPAAEITVREDAPAELRRVIPVIAEMMDMELSEIRQVICRVLLVRPDPKNWLEKSVWEEITRLMEEAQWYEVYDIAEALYLKLASNRTRDFRSANKFTWRLNDFFVKNGIGWELRNGKIIHRGSEAFAKSTHKVPDLLDESGFQRAANEMREALRDISRRPELDITGAIQHAMAALEATAREVTDQPKPTLGKLVPSLNLPKPLGQAVHNLWGYASEHGRHIREQQSVDRTEAELIVAVAGSLCAFLAQRQS